MQLTDLEPPDPPRGHTSHVDPLERVRDGFEAVIGSPSEEDPPLDVRAFLLDPPPSSEQLAATERRVQLVRRGSLAAAAIVAVVLVAPIPSRGGGPATEDAGAAGLGAPAVEAPVLPIRVDVPPVARRRPVAEHAALPKRPRSTQRRAPASAAPRRPSSGGSTAPRA
ncbi:MAG: hypothetical protein JWM86_749, partial [Thermoleophilia bacterium]|nr:hypothetical protein [Thermoleophilia bacterium]